MVGIGDSMVYVFCYRGDMVSSDLRKEVLHRYHDITNSMVYAHLYYEDGAPHLDNGKYVSITHTGDLLGERIELIAIGDSAVGIDIEREDRMLKMDIATRYFTHDEIEYISGDNRHFLELWTKKESYGKSRGEGLYLDSVMNIEGFREYPLYDGFITMLYSEDCDVTFVAI